MRDATELLFPAATLRLVGSRIFQAVGALPDAAAIVARSLVEANLAGHDSHGVIRIPEYVERARAGTIRPAARPSLTMDRRATALVSGNWGFGQVAGIFAIDQGVARAKEHGVAAVGLIRCNHLGRLGEYMERASVAGCVALAWVGGLGGAHQAVPYGGAEPAYGTNPIAAAFPAGPAGPVVVDFATTAIAGGKVMVADAAGELLAPGCIVDRHGRPTTDPQDFLGGGALLPFGGHKGYALAVLAELLGQALTGAAQAGDEGGGGPPFRRAGALFVVLHAGLFCAEEKVEDVAVATVERIRAVRPAPGFERVLVPGEPEALVRKGRQADGIPLPLETWHKITAAATSVHAPLDDIPDYIGAGRAPGERPA